MEGVEFKKCFHPKNGSHRFYWKSEKKTVGFWYKIQFLKFVKRILKTELLIFGLLLVFLFSDRFLACFYSKFKFWMKTVNCSIFFGFSKFLKYLIFWIVSDRFSVNRRKWTGPVLLVFAVSEWFSCIFESMIMSTPCFLKMTTLDSP
jgi:hypothetical protein